MQLPSKRAPSRFTGASVADAVRTARARMDETTSGHDEAKREVLKLVCQERCGGAGSGAYSSGWEGPPGTGKTHFVRTGLARALGRPFVSIPLGGATDVSYLLGSLYTYEGAKEGRLAAALMETGCVDPIVYFDEVDKVSQTERGQEIIATLIHLVDPSANTALRDRYFHDIDLDFSKCTFVFSYNDASLVSPVLLDRVRRIGVQPPTPDERERILERHLLPRVQARLNTDVALSEDARDALLAAPGDGAGMRGTEKALDAVLAAAQLCGVRPDQRRRARRVRRRARPGRRRPRERRGSRARTWRRRAAPRRSRAGRRRRQ